MTVLWNRRAFLLPHSIRFGIEETPLRCNRDHLSLSDIKESAGLNQLLLVAH